MPRLDLSICGARNLTNTETFGKIDPYCTVSFEGKQFKTNPIDDTTNPEWNEVFKFNVGDNDSSQMVFSVWNKNTVSDEFLGEYRLSIGNLERGKVEDKWVLLQNSKGNAELHIRFQALDFGDVKAQAPPSQPHQQQQQYPPQQQQQQQQYQPQQQQQYPPQQQQQYPPQQQQQQQQYPPQQQHQNQPQQQQCQQQPQVQLFQVSGAAEVYVEDVFQGVRLRRHIDSGEEFNRRGYDWGKIRQVSFEELAKVPQGPSLLAPGVRALPNHGGKFKSLFYQNGAVMVLLDGLLRHVPHADAYNLLFEFGINGTEFNQVTNQAVGAPLPNDTRIVSQSGALYLIDSQYKRPVCRHIVNPDVMSIKQFSWSRAQPVSSLPYPVGAPIGLE